MKITAKSASVILEALGLVTLLGASLWQFVFSDSTDQIAREWSMHNLEEVQIHMMGAMRGLSELHVVKDPEVEVDPDR